jgi:uncharacterized protein (DUF1778 family)
MGKRRTPSARLELRISPKLSEDLTRAYEERGMTKTDFVCHAIRASIDGNTIYNHNITEKSLILLVKKISEFNSATSERLDALEDKIDKIIEKIEMKK